MERNNKVMHRLLVNLSGYGNKGDAVTILRNNGTIVLVSNGVKKFSIERINLAICPHQQQAVRT